MKGSSAMKEIDEIQKVSQLYKVLSDPTRLRILLLLKQGELNVTAIGEKLSMEQSAVSHQLKLLRDSHVVRSRREGKTIYYTLDDHHVIDILNQTFEHIKHQ
ncbi:ArsR family transcriptional regulator [Enterococcus sp. DIV0212c]|uniref:ArsR family transcriptional regulator n=3 Tax=Enterococcus TaxID=1350 RepID=A0AAQ3W5X1_9ENTE|nr:metalloregulator ArsR/SmtB family transcription factor [Enterococcus sp. DIV0212c]MBO0441908.1 winged helix-turn-helix transcriptional regulator [Enterococcus sp. DIV0869a]MBO1354616.1 winged helix-turn-helix transcriptional regulator [Enterococcus sp. DIV0212c]OTN84891.1 ArsR family transcriptional regulator [Enterococcus sp. 7F3_DIV0205]